MDPDIPDECRPDKVHFYLSGNFKDDYLRVMVDDAYPLAAKDHPVVEHYRNIGYHLLVVVHDAVFFICGHGRERPKKLLLDWNL